MTKPTPAQRRLLESVRDKTLLLWVTEKTCEICERNGWMYWSKDKCYITPKGLEALK
jgi:hypothetical protein